MRASGPRSAISGHLRIFYGSATSSLLMLARPSVYAWRHLGPCGLRFFATPVPIARCITFLLDCDRIFVGRRELSCTPGSTMRAHLRRLLYLVTGPVHLYLPLSAAGFSIAIQFQC